MKSGNRNFLEPSGTLQVCNGTSLPLPQDGMGAKLKSFKVSIKYDLQTADHQRHGLATDVT